MKGQDIRGLWWGPTFATLYNTIWYNLIIFRMDWPKLIAGIIEREEKEEQVRKELEQQRLLQKSQSDDFVAAKGDEKPSANQIN